MALENTLPSLELARLLGVDAIEFDVQKTKDGALVLCHDSDLSRVSDSNVKISDTNLRDLEQIILNDKQSTIPTLKQALQTVGKTPVIIELKANGCIEELLRILHQFPHAQIVVTSFKQQEAIQLKATNPKLPVYLAERIKALEAVFLARRTGMDGLDLNFWLLNPLVYWLAKRYKLEIMVYTINNRLLTRFVNLLYPRVAICTDPPEWFIKHPWLKLRRTGRTRSGQAGSQAFHKRTD